MYYFYLNLKDVSIDTHGHSHRQTTFEPNTMQCKISFIEHINDYSRTWKNDFCKISLKVYPWNDMHLRLVTIGKH